MTDREAETTSSSQNISFPWWVRLCRRLWKAFAFLYGTIIFGLLISIGATWLISSKGEIPKNSPLSSLATHWPLVLLIGCCLTILAIITRRLSQWPFSNTASTSPFQHDRRKTLQSLAFTYQTIRENLLQGADCLNLQLSNKADAVSNPSRRFVRESKQSERPVSTNTSIAAIFDSAGQELLILGEPGAGKTTLLVELAKELVRRAEIDSTLPLPIYLPLTSWATKRQPLHQWLGEQISQFYHIRPSLAQYWISQRQVLPMLDSLDEITDSARSSCIAAINAYHQEYLSPLVVCSRIEKYTDKKRSQLLKLNHAVVVQPLSAELVDHTLTNLGQPLDALRKAINKSSDLRELARTPLMLNILVRTYAGFSVRQMNKRGASLRKQVFDEYVQRMIQQKENNTDSPLKLTQMRLHWLAQQMQLHNQTVLFLEQLQPDWLPRRQRIFYRCSVWLFIALFEQLAWLLVFGLGLWLLKGKVANLSEGLVGALPLAITAGASFGLFYTWRPIQPSEVFTWAWKDFWLRLLAGVVIGLTGGAALIFCRRLIAKTSGKQLKERFHLTPNEGIYRSAKNGLLGGLFGGLAAGIIYALLVGLSIDPLFGLFEGIFYVLFVSLLVGLVLGLVAFIQHYILRFWLWRTHALPWRVVRFLDNATDRILLRRVDGGYSFVHRLLLDYFADLDTNDPSLK